nr:hypothetical protein [Tanacetum cinerariifolium]
MHFLLKFMKKYETIILCLKGKRHQTCLNQDIHILSSTNEAVNTAHDVSAASSQGQDLEQIDSYDLEEMDLKRQSYQAKEGPTDFALMVFSSSGSSSSDIE